MLATALTVIHLSAVALAVPTPPSAIPTDIIDDNTNERLEDIFKQLTPHQRELLVEQSLNNLQIAMAEFTQSIYLHMIEEEESNFVFSPLSLHSALSMLYLGTTLNSTTQEELQIALGRFTSRPHLKAGYRQIIETYSQENDFLYGNNFWIQNGFEIKEKFAKTVRDNLNSGVENIDFGAVNSTEIVNNWVSNMTGGEITKMVDNFSSNTVIYLANALYFKEKWLIPFDDTHHNNDPLLGEFETPTEKLENVPMLQQINDKAKYGEISLTSNHIVDIVTLPYENELFEMQIIIPKSHSDMSSLEHQMNQSNTRDLRLHEQSYFNLFSHPKNESVDGEFIDEIYLKMPKFQIKSNLDVVKPLQKLGARTVFEAGAELGELATGLGNLAVSKISHTALVKVTKEGTEGAAATGAEIVLLSASFSEQKDIVINRPFIFIVQDVKNKIPVLVRRVMDPTKKIP